MRLPGRMGAAIEVLTDIETRHRPASEALKDWGVSHRFAGAADRAAIGNLVYDALRKRLSAAHLGGADTPRAIVLATVVSQWGETPEALQAAFTGDRFAPDALSEAEITALGRPEPFAGAADHVRADMPEWIAPMLAANFADEWIAEARALALRPPLDLRVNTLKATRDKVLAALGRHDPRPTSIAREGIRIAPGRRDARTPNLRSEPGYAKGWFEIQDEGSQIVADLVFARPGEQILDYCAGGGGKSLAFAAAMENRGQIYAFDRDRQRLSPIYERLRRAGARNVQVRPPDEASLQDLVGRMDRVVVDAPCSGSGAWRRRPDTKWRLTPEGLERRLVEQEEALSEAAGFVRPGGYLVYITCSVLPAENEGQIEAFLAEQPGFSLVSAGEVWQELFGFDKPRPWSADLNSVTLTPASTDTDGFYFAVMARSAPPGTSADRPANSDTNSAASQP